MNTEPIIVGLAPAAITGLITAAVNAANAFGVTQISDAQVNSLNALAIAFMVVAGGIGIWWARRNATPTASPTLPEGTIVKTTNPATGEVTGATTLPSA